MEIKLEFSMVLAILLAELLFGIFYNMLIGWAERRRYLEGYTSLAVTGGVLITVGMTAIFNWAWALLTLGSFCASGLPMIAGSIWRHVKAREHEQEAALYHWKTEPALTPDPSILTPNPSSFGRGEVHPWEREA